MKIPKLTFVLFTYILLIQLGCSLKSEKINKTSHSINDSSLLRNTSTLNKLNGVYVGLDDIGVQIDPAYPNKKEHWYHLSYLKIKGDSAYLDQSPISIYKRDTSYSENDGGFYYWSGLVSNTDTTLKFKLKELFCDMCGELMKKNVEGKWVRDYQIKEWTGKLSYKGIIINGYLFTKTIKRDNFKSEHPEPFLEKH